MIRRPTRWQRDVLPPEPYVPRTCWTCRKLIDRGMFCSVPCKIQFEEAEQPKRCEHPPSAIVRKYGGVACNSCGEILQDPDDDHC